MAVHGSASEVTRHHFCPTLFVATVAHPPKQARLLKGRMLTNLQPCFKVTVIMALFVYSLIRKKGQLNESIAEYLFHHPASLSQDRSQ